MPKLKRVKKAVIPAAGLGTRFLPATKAQPKEMLPIVDKPTIQYVVEEAVTAGIEDILIITGRGKRAIEDHFDHCLEIEAFLRAKGKEAELKMVREISAMADIHYVRQKEPLGLGHAVYCARKFMGEEPFAVLLGDDIIDSAVPCIKQLIDVYAERGGSVLGVQPVSWDDVHKYGIVGSSELGGVAPGAPLCRVERLVEKPPRKEAPSNLAVLGRYILNRKFFLFGADATGRGEIQLTDALNVMAQSRPVWAYTLPVNVTMWATSSVSCKQLSNLRCKGKSFPGTSLPTCAAWLRFTPAVLIGIGP